MRNLKVIRYSPYYRDMTKIYRNTRIARLIVLVM